MANPDPRDHKLAKLIVTHSVKAKPGELVYIDAVGLDSRGLAQAIAEETLAVGATPFVYINDPEIQRKIILNSNEETMKKLSDFEVSMMKKTDCYIGIRGTSNSFELADVPREKMELFTKHIRIPVHLQERVKNTRWCVMRFPNSAMAQMAEQSREAFADYYYRVCTVDYPKMGEACAPLEKLMGQTDKVSIQGNGTNLDFSIRDIPVVSCYGEHNIPDGECFTAPVRDSINGTVHFNCPTVWEGKTYTEITLTFKDGKIVEATGGDETQTKNLNEVLDQDEGARYVGEFAIGFNPVVQHPMKDILFDEKIGGSFHMAMGNAYENKADNGNRSGLHWDMICIQRPEYGGGTIAFDGEVIRKDGVFLHPDLQGLNPENLR